MTDTTDLIARAKAAVEGVTDGPAPLDEQYDTMRDVVQNPYGAWEAIQTLVGVARELLAALEQARARAEAAEAEAERLRGVLRPFAECANHYDPVEDDDAERCWVHEYTPTLGALRAARVALKGDSHE